ncbi:MAG: phosphoribosyl-AMP cyclohydrolase [Atopobiaceae bacterium]|jgi:phosphoribosyl-AMP cyclohydrolase|uniref:phosphoribosyl-AMP cyclohydrolase n=1 Tax=Paratractidigestivibacter sp. TaxID=2847316 RepID=UPI000D7A7458|nr:phosphoribosyl-AMP cyclohydrolase [Atopobiaceae bacterium]PWM33382.1 MAG: phosphoribosyl-AMP cyclohydrolase [Coriobacteriia bacterium]
MSHNAPDYTYAGEAAAPVSADAVNVKFDATGLVPCVVQQEQTGEVLMVAWMNAESLALTIKTGTTWFWSRSRQELWNKGATSGNIQHVKHLLVDCDADTLVAVVDSPGPACHTGHRSCFFREIKE